jgi:hypothetical protein
VIRRADYATPLYFYLALTSLASGGRSVGVVHFQTKSTKLIIIIIIIIIIIEDNNTTTTTTTTTNNNNNNNSIEFFIFYVLSQQLQGQLQTQHSTEI